jgi:hypothetical protein
VNRNLLAYELFSGVCLTLMGFGWVAYGLRDQVNP